MTLATHWHKRVPRDMAAEYIGKGWVFHLDEGAWVVLIWPHNGVPN